MSNMIYHVPMKKKSEQIIDRLTLLASCLALVGEVVIWLGERCH